MICCSKTQCRYTLRMKKLSLLLILLFLTACSEPDKPGTALYIAIKRGDIDQIERHIYWKTDINSLNVDGNTPLQESAITGRIVIARLLIKNGATVNTKNKYGKTALQLALENGRTQLAEVLVKKFNADFDATPMLFEMIKAGVSDRDVIGFLADNGADLDALNADGQTPLILAVQSNNRLQAKHLITREADVNKAGKQGLFPLDIARTQNSVELIRLLENNGALSSNRQ